MPDQLFLVIKSKFKADAIIQKVETSLLKNAVKGKASLKGGLISKHC
jgi:hypothetical protein